MAKLSPMTHSYRTNTSSASPLDGRGAHTAVCEKKKTVETGMYVDPNNNCSWLHRVIDLWEVIILLVVLTIVCPKILCVGLFFEYLENKTR